MKQGFSLIEMIISLALLTIISTVLYTAYNTLLKTDQIGEKKIDLDMRSIIFLHQIEKDLTGIFVPNQAFPEEPEAPETKTAQAAKPDDKSEKKQKRTILEKPFYSINKDDQLSLLTFITSSITTSYQTEQSESEKLNIPGTPHYARVMYRVEKSVDNKDLYRIMRQESDQLDIKAFETKGTIRPYEIITDIASLKISYLRPKDEPQDGNTQKKTKAISKKSKKEKQQEKNYDAYEKTTIWPPANEADKANALPDIPHVILIELVMQAGDKPIQLYVPSFVLPQLYPIAQEEQKPAEKEEKKPEPPKAPPATPQVMPHPVVTLNKLQPQGRGASFQKMGQLANQPMKNLAFFMPQGDER